MELIAELAHVHVFSVSHKKNQWWYKKHTIGASFGKVHYWTIPSFFLLKLPGYFFIPWMEAIRFRKKVKKIDFFHLHISYPYAAFTLFLRCLPMDTWLLTEHWHGFTFFDNSFAGINFLLKKLIVLYLKKTHKISVVSLFLKNNMAARFPFIKEKITLTSNVIRFPTRMDNRKKTDMFYLLSISNLLDYPKNISFLIRVAAEVSGEYPNVQLHIYGDGKDKSRLVQYADGCGVLDRIVFFKGAVKNQEIMDVYANYHAFILLSRFETFSVVTVEALANGLPVIVTRCGAPEEYMMDGVNGYLVEKDNMEQTKQAILNLIRNYSSFDAEKIQSTVKDRFSKEKILEQFKKLYEL